MVKVQVEIIDNYRKEHSLTIRQFCKKCGISLQSYYKFINGQLHIRITVFLKILRTMKNKSSDIIEETTE